MDWAGVGSEHGDLGDGQRPEQARADMQGHSSRGRDRCPVLAPDEIDHGIERRPVQSELHKDRRHPRGVFCIGARPDEHRQGDGEEGESIWKELALGLQRPRVD